MAASIYLPRARDLLAYVRSLRHSAEGTGEWDEFFEGLRNRETPWQIFVVEHHWFDVLRAAVEDVYALEIPPCPFAHCIFEFRLRGRVIFALCAARPDGIAQAAWFELMPTGRFEFISDSIARDLGQLYCATLIALESGVAASREQIIPAKLNKARVKRGASPLQNYRVVEVRRRPAAAELAADASLGSHRSPRLHFRIGHWAHNEAFKADAKAPEAKRWWVKWCLVGDPDLGFIDKHYRL